MRSFSEKISITHNSRGVYSLDTIMGCPLGHYSIDMFDFNNGCYNECYAGKYSKVYGYDFTKAVKRDFVDIKHLESIRSKLNKIDYIRIGTSGDPSYDWDHTFKVIEKICDYAKNIVVVTRHWNNIPEKYYAFINKYSIIFNSSISALDNEDLYSNCYKQYKILSKITNSFLRVVSCKFNTIKKEGYLLNQKQIRLLRNKNVIETVLRISKNNHYYNNGLILAEKIKFLNGNVLASLRSKNIYFGSCKNCKQKCGINA